MKSPRGMTLIDVLVGTALMLIIFLGLTTLLRTSLQIASIAKARSIATTIASSQMEYIRSFPYDSVGTIAGIPSGVIPQNTTTTQNGIDFAVRTFIQYNDDPADGLGGLDSNGITIDYKIIKVTVTYIAGGTSRAITMVSNYSPIGIETTNGGGTLRINVLNQAGVGVAGASVRIVNTVTSPTVDLTTFSDSTGIVFLPGALPSSEYQVYVTKNGYSSAQTYTRDVTNQNPTPGYLTVVPNVTTTGTFAIDVLSNLSIRTFSPIATSTWTDSFSDSSKIQSSSGTSVSLGELVLAGAPGTYPSSGTARSVFLSPATLASWKNVYATSTTPAGTSVVFHVVDGAGIFLPDAVLPGNSSGFTAVADLSGVSTSTYPVLGLVASLTTSDINVTPSLQEWSIWYTDGPTQLPNVNFTLLGGKTIGTTGTGALLYKTSIATSTDSGGVRNLALEWDSYQLGLSSFDTVEACNAPPYLLSPGGSLTSSLMLIAPTSNSVLISVRDTVSALPGASVTLSRTGYSKTVTTTACGSAYFGSLTSASDYSISVSKSGYTTVNATGVSVSGHTFYAASIDI